MDKSLWEQLKPILEIALTLDPSDRDAYLKTACSGNLNLYDAALNLLANESPVTFELSQAIRVSQVESAYHEGQILGHYKLIEEIGRGGMGTVFLAERTDGEYDQRVAIKILQVGRSSDSLIQKLRNERQILANLKHPNIVNILDGGTSDQGIPFIVMEYVDGTMITDYIEEHNLNLQQKLNLFQKLCEVISFAHQKLIIHRDIKPSNILISQSGEIKLLDFGIAKILNQQGQSFQETQQLFITPDYASPEHIKGQHLTISSEVYSLGILFYQILTGVNPFKSEKKNLSEVMEMICEFNPLPPSKRFEKTKNKLKGDIDNICLKALRKDAKERYHSVDHFSQDIDRYLQHIPVTATKDQWSYRAKKFVSRNRNYILSGLSIFTITLAGLFSSLYQAGEAKAMFNDLRGLTGSMLFEFYDGISSLEGATQAKEMIVSKTITYLEKMENRNSGNHDLMNDVSDGYQRLGNIQGNSYYANMGLSDDALKSFEKAVTISENLVTKYPTNQKYLFSLSQAFLGLGDVLYTLNELDSALLRYKKSNHLLLGLTEKYPDSLNYVLALSESFNRIGDVSGMYGYSNLGNTAMAISSYNQSIDILEKLVVKAPDNTIFRNSLALSLAMLSNLYTVTGKFDEAIGAGYKSVSSFEALLEQDPHNYLRKTNILVTKNAMREPLSEVLRLDEALTLLKGVESNLLESQKIDPENIHIQSNLAINYNALGRVLSEKGQYENAALEFQKAYILNQSLVKNSENNMEQWQNLGFTLEFMGNNYLENNQFSEAIQKYDEAVALYKKIDTGLINIVMIKKNVCRIHLGEIQSVLLQQHQKELLNLENKSKADTLNIRNVVFLSEFYGYTARAMMKKHSVGSANGELYDPCYYFRRSLEFTDILKSKNALSPLRERKRDALIKAFSICAL